MKRICSTPAARPPALPALGLDFCWQTSGSGELRSVSPPVLGMVVIHYRQGQPEAFPKSPSGNQDAQSYGREDGVHLLRGGIFKGGSINKETQENGVSPRMQAL